MMYDNKLVVAILANGKVLREHKDQVYLPFGQEYTLRFKNLNSLRALVRVSVDGQDATEGTTGLIVPPNGTVDLERFIKGGNLVAGNKFKFIERTQKIEDGPRGIQAEDGLIRVEFEFEQQPAKVEFETIKRTYVEDYWRRNPHYWNGPWYTTNAIGSSLEDYKTKSATRGVSSSIADMKLGSVSATSGDAQLMNASFSATSATLTSTASAGSETFAVPQNATAAFVNDVGITVPGSLSEQKFEQGSWFPTDGQKHVMVLKLLGVHGEKAISVPVTVKTKQKCTTCGHTNKSGAKFCSECGTGLELA
jgi:hypothetical protein